LVAHYRNAVAAGSGVALYQLEVLTFSIDHRWMSALGQKQPMSALPLKADMTTTNSRAAYPLPQHMIKMLTVGAFGNDMAADPSLVGLAAASSASSDMSHARMVSPLSSQIVSMDRRGSKLSPCPIR